ncbi:hypothetical protein Paes_2007 [Prosthecochloris aestuarii DSM 271]|uniref:Uncharacterized protein n=1 Tax=Prosthecochloris aestuarii (strain DSM 271 / SK 413) TaxID=290512 RepID=B4S571_PROA2|nr:hypothetical protein Paes_2007 [Prosthecochloris aestuarii DSM 271]
MTRCRLADHALRPENPTEKSNPETVRNKLVTSSCLETPAGKIIIMDSMYFYPIFVL